MDLLTQPLPQVVGQATLAADHAAPGRAPALTAGRADGFVHRQHDVGDPGLRRGLGQAIAAARAAHAVDQAPAAQARIEQLFQVGQGDFLPPGDLRQGHRTTGAVPRQVGHGHDRIAALGAEAHAPIPLPESRAHSGAAWHLHRAPLRDRRRQPLGIPRGFSARRESWAGRRGKPSWAVKYFRPRAFTGISMPESDPDGGRGPHRGAAMRPGKRRRRAHRADPAPHPKAGGHIDSRPVTVQLLSPVRRSGVSRPCGSTSRERGPQPGRVRSGHGRAGGRRHGAGLAAGHQPQAQPQCWGRRVPVLRAYIGMQLLMRRPETDGFISVSPPTNMYDFSFLAPCPASGLQSCTRLLTPSCRPTR